MPPLELTHQNITHCVTVWPVGDIYLKQVFIIVNGITCPAGTIANILLLAGLIKTKLIRHSTMKVIFSLALSDLGISSFIVPLFTAMIYSKSMSCIMEKVFQSVNFIFGMNTGNMLLILSIDRVLLISWPRFYRKWITVKFTMFVLLCSWTLAFVVCVTTFFMKPSIILRALLVTALMFFTLSVTAYVKIALTVREHRLRVQGNVGGTVKAGDAEATRKSVETTEQGSSIKTTDNKRNDIYASRVQGNVIGTVTTDDAQATSESRAMKMDSSQENPERHQDMVERSNQEGADAFGSSATEITPQHFEKSESRKTIADQKPPNHATSSLRQDPNGVTRSSFNRELNVTWTVAIVLGTLFLCYIPFVCAGYLWAHQEYDMNLHTSRLQRSAYAWTLTLAYLHSSFNPFIIIARNRTLRRRVKELIFKCKL